MAETPQRARAKSGALSAIPAENLLIGVPKKGRLHEQCIKLLVDGAGLDYKRPDRVDIAHCKDVPVGGRRPRPRPRHAPRAVQRASAAVRRRARWPFCHVRSHVSA
jgi:hypothetical protein